MQPKHLPALSKITKYKQDEVRVGAIFIDSAMLELCRQRENIVRLPLEIVATLFYIAQQRDPYRYYVIKCHKEGKFTRTPIPRRIILGVMRSAHEELRRIARS